MPTDQKFELCGNPYEERAQLVFPVKKGRTNDFLAYFAEPLALPLTSKVRGCGEIHVSIGEKDGEEFVAATGFWSKKGDYANYFAHPERQPDSTFMKGMGEFVSGAPEILCTNPIKHFSSGKYSFGTDYAERTQIKLCYKEGCRDDLLALFEDQEIGLPFTFKQQGILEASLCQGTNEDGSEYFAITGFWEKEGDFGAYFATPERANDSVFKTTLISCLSSPPDIRVTKNVGVFNSSSRIVDFLRMQTFALDGNTYEERAQLVIPVKQGKTNDFLEFFSGPLGLPLTLKVRGCGELHMSTGQQDGEEYLAVTGFWSKKGDYANYFAHPERQPDSAFMQGMQEFLSGPPEILCTNPIKHFSSGKYSFGTDYAERTQIKLCFKEGCADDILALFNDQEIGLPFTFKQKGVLEASLCLGKNEDGSEYFAITGFWEKEGDFAAYFATPERADDSVFKKTLISCLSSPPDIRVTKKLAVFNADSKVHFAPMPRQGKSVASEGKIAGDARLEAK